MENQLVLRSWTEVTKAKSSWSTSAYFLSSSGEASGGIFSIGSLIVLGPTTPIGYGSTRATWTTLQRCRITSAPDLPSTINNGLPKPSSTEPRTRLTTSTTPAQVMIEFPP